MEVTINYNGQRIPDGKGGWKNHREDTTHWNDKGKAENWRAAWADYANKALEAAGGGSVSTAAAINDRALIKIPLSTWVLPLPRWRSAVARPKKGMPTARLPPSGI